MRKCDSFSLSLCPMPPYQGVFTNSTIFLISNWIYTLLQRAFNSCSNFEIFHQEIIKLRDIFNKRVKLVVSSMCVSKISWTGFS